MSGPDFVVQDEGTIVLLRPHTVLAREWVRENLSDEAIWYVGAVVVEPRYLPDILTGLADDGLTVEVDR